MVDTLNHRLRRTTAVNKPCLFDPGPYRSLFEVPESLAFYEALNDIYQKCGADVLTAANGFSFKDAAIEYLTKGTEDRVLQFVCMDDSDCDSVGLTLLREAECECRKAFEVAVSNPVYVECPSDDAANDDWHKISSLLFACYLRLSPRTNGAGGSITGAQLGLVDRTIGQFVDKATIDIFWDTGLPDPPAGNPRDFYSLAP